MENTDMEILDMNDNLKLQDEELEKEKRRQELIAYREELKSYEKMGALKFQDFVFKVEAAKFKVLKTLCPNFIKYFDKYIDHKKKRKIKYIKRTAGRRDKVEKNHPKLLKYYDKLSVINCRRKDRVKDLKEKFRKKVKVFSPALLNFYDKYYKTEDIYEGLTPEEKIAKVISLSKISKMAIRKELNYEQNANYHMDSNKPTEIVKYLEWNKKVHVRGTVVNVVTILILSVATTVGFTPALPLIVAELLEMGINFECINIQNYNMCRFKMKKEVLEKRAQRKLERNIQKYGEGSKVVYNSLVKNDDLPSFSQIISEITDIEQARQLRRKLAEAQAERIAVRNRRNVK